MKEIRIKSGEAKKVFSRACSSIPETIEFDAASINPAETVSGTVEIRGSSWIIPKKPIPYPLHPNNSFEKGLMDSNYALYVIPDVDVKITMKKSTSWRLFWWVIAVAMAVVLIAGVIIILSQN